MATRKEVKKRIDVTVAQFERDCARSRGKYMERFRGIMREIEAQRLRALRKEIKN